MPTVVANVHDDFMRMFINRVSKDKGIVQLNENVNKRVRDEIINKDRVVYCLNSAGYLEQTSLMIKVYPLL